MDAVAVRMTMLETSAAAEGRERVRRTGDHDFAERNG